MEGEGGVVTAAVEDGDFFREEELAAVDGNGTDEAGRLEGEVQRLSELGGLFLGSAAREERKKQEQEGTEELFHGTPQSKDLARRDAAIRQAASLRTASAEAPLAAGEGVPASSSRTVFTYCRQASLHRARTSRKR